MAYRPKEARPKARVVEKLLGAPLEAPRRPLVPRFPRRRDRPLHLRRPRLMRLREHVPMAMRHDHVYRPAGVDVLATDDEGNLQLAPGELRQGPLELRPLRRSGDVAEHGLVDGRRDLGNAVHYENLTRCTTLRRYVVRVWQDHLQRTVVAS